LYSGCGWEVHGGDGLSCTLDYSRAASKQGCRYNRYIARTPAYVVYCRLQVAMMSLQVGLGVSDREASDTTPPRCLVCPVPEDQHASKDKTCSRSRAVHPTITFSPFLFIHSLSKVRLYIRLCGVWYRSEVVGLPRTVALSIIARHISSGKGSALVTLDTGAPRRLCESPTACVSCPLRYRDRKSRDLRGVRGRARHAHEIGRVLHV